MMKVKETIWGYAILAYDPETDCVYWDGFYNYFFDAIHKIRKELDRDIAIGAETNIQFTIVEWKEGSGDGVWK